MEERDRHAYRAVRAVDSKPIPVAILRMKVVGEEPLPGLEGVEFFPQVTVEDGGGGLPARPFGMPIYGPALTNFLDTLERAFRSLPALVARHSAQQVLAKAREAVIENSAGLSEHTIEGLKNSERLRYVYYLTSDPGRYAVDFGVSYFLDPHLGVGSPALVATVFELGEEESKQIYAFVLTNPLQFYADLKHYDPRLGYCLKK